MTWGLWESLARYQKRLKPDATSAPNYFKPDGSRYAPGELFRQPDLAKTLKRIAEQGAPGFYEGPVADALVAAMEEGGGIITREDLKNYRMVEREPVRGTYRGYEIVTMPPPSSGGVHIVQMMNVFEGWDMKSLGHNSAAYIHRLAETMKYAYADRSKYLGDPDYYDVPVAALTDKAYAAAIRSRIDLAHATPSTEIAPAPKLPYESKDTTHFSVMDGAGNMVANTYTLNFTYGNGRSVPGMGFLLNNEMDDFSAKPGVANAFGLLGGEANAIAPGKRPLSSMTPTFVFRDGEPFMATGSPGGSLIITVTMQSVLNAVDFGMNVQAAVNAPRVHHQWFPDKLLMEPGHSVDTRRMLGQMGHVVRTEPSEAFDRVLGSVQAIIRLPNGVITGGSDPRRPGASAAGY
jgi:gamma-glutamyltranspeptidase/glutathione hydrolase